MFVGTKEPDERERNSPIETEARAGCSSPSDSGRPARVLTLPGSWPRVG